MARIPRSSQRGALELREQESDHHALALGDEDIATIRADAPGDLVEQHVADTGGRSELRIEPAMVVDQVEPHPEDPGAIGLAGSADLVLGHVGPSISARTASTPTTDMGYTRTDQGKLLPFAQDEGAAADGRPLVRFHRASGSSPDQMPQGCRWREACCGERCETSPPAGGK